MARNLRRLSGVAAFRVGASSATAR